MKKLDVNEIEQLRESIKPFDSALLNAMEKEGDISVWLNNMRQSFGVRWNITLEYETSMYRPMRETKPSNLICDTLKIALENREADKTREFLESGEIGKDPLQDLQKLQCGIEDLESTIDGLKVFSTWVSRRDKDDAAVFFLQSLDDEAKLIFSKIAVTLEEPIAEAEVVLETANEAKKEILETVISKANKELEGLAGWLKENEDAFQMMDLKLHDASFYEYESMEDDFPLLAKEIDLNAENSPFYNFCEDTYDTFCEWMKEEGIDWDNMRHQVGRTSSFYLHDEGNGVCLSRRDFSIDMSSTMECFLDIHGYPYEDMKFDKDGRIDREYLEANFPDNIANLIYIAGGDFGKDVRESYADMLKVYDYIHDTKERQVEYFKEWLQDVQDTIIPELEEPEM